MNVNENALIQVQDLKKSFGTQVVLDGITTEIDQGEVVAIIGPSGCGKSTFLRSLNLLEEPTSGTILFEGTDITDKSVDINKMRQKIGMVFQQFNLFKLYHTEQHYACTGKTRIDDTAGSGEKGKGTVRKSRTPGTCQ